MKENDEYSELSSVIEENIYKVNDTFRNDHRLKTIREILEINKKSNSQIVYNDLETG